MAKQIKKRIIIIPLVLIITLVSILWFYGIIIFNYPSDKKYPVKGVDVSAYQGDIDWNVLASEDIEFAFIKATEGSSFLDEKFSTNYEESRKSGLKTGAYHFFSYDSSGEAQAENFIKNVPKTDDMLPPVVDIEFYGDKYKNIPDAAETQKNLTALLKKLEEYYEKKPIIYATYKSYNLYIKDNYPENYIWIRDIFFTPKLKDNREWTFWQFTDKKRLDDYKGEEKSIDVNVFNGSLEDLENL